MRLGMGVSADDTFLVLRGLPTMKLRFEAHDRSAREIAAWLKSRSEMTHILHPAFDDCPGHATWKRDFTGAGGLFSVLFDPRFTEAQTDRFIDSLKLFKIGYSWGGANSLAVPYRIAAMRSHWPHQGQLVRLNIGLEDTRDLIADLEQAFATLA
jgi:cystathionine beta-lyase